MIDYLLKNFRIISGNGEPEYKGDIGIKNGLIVKPREARHTIIASDNEYLMPGFCDIHSHNDLYVLNDKGERLLYQGITTTVNGNCGLGVFPVKSQNALRDSLSGILGEFEDYKWKDYSSLKKYALKKGIPVNALYLVPHSALRLYTIGLKSESLNQYELNIMLSKLKEELLSGAYGFSTGLIYPPACFADENELIEIAKIVKSHNKLFAIHISDEGDRVISAVEQAIIIAKKSGVRMEISHLKAYGEKNWHKIEYVLELINKAVQEGAEIYFDSYPYTVGSTSLKSLLPKWTRSLSKRAIVEAIKEPLKKKSIIKDMNNPNTKWENYYTVMGADRINPVNMISEKYKKFNGLSLEEISNKCNISSEEVVLDILIEEDLKPDMLLYGQSAAMVEKIIKEKRHSFGSDGLFGDFPHPRAYAAFTRIFTNYVFNKKLLSLEEAVYKASCFNFQKLGIKDRGEIKQGYRADIIIMNRDLIKENATFLHPKRYSKGIRYVFINGRLSVKDYQTINANNGSII